MKHLSNVLEGLAGVLSIAPSGDAYLQPDGGFRRDREMLRGDVRSVGMDIQKTVRAYGEQGAKGSGYKQKR